MENFSSPKRRDRVGFLQKNTFINIFDFVNKTQSLIRKVSSLKKKAKNDPTAI